MFKSVIFAAVLAVSTAACAQEAVKVSETEVLKPETVVVTAEPIIVADNHQTNEPQYKTVCLDVQGKDGKPVIDPKTGKPKQNCTKVRVHKKFEGTKIEDAKKN